MRLGIPIDLPFCLRFDEFSYIAINNHLTSVAFPGIIPELRCLFFCTECIIECFVHIILSNHMGTPILFYVLLELGSALGVGFSEDERFLQLQIVGTDSGDVALAHPAIQLCVASLTNTHSFSILSEHPVLWVDPISTDECLRNELRGLYYTKRRYVENDAGNRFLYDAYGVKWLAFDPRSQM